MHGNGERFRFIGVYGWPDAANKHRTWDLMRALCHNVTSPVLFGGDFNEILSYDEKEGRGVCPL